jgi:NADH:ubiquinone reductase (H+-translocating)
MKKRVLILGGGFAGVGLLRSLQKKFKKNINVEISLVSDDNFFLFTPMLPEVASGMLHTKHTTNYKIS